MSTVSASEMVAKKILDHYFGNFRNMDNYRPVWLQGMELDRFYPDLGVAIEFQGRQHFMKVEDMGQTAESFNRQLGSDSRKRLLIEQQGLRLFALDIFDLTPDRMKRYAAQIKEIGHAYASAKGNTDILRRLSTVRLDITPHTELFRSADRLGRAKPRPKKTLWQRLFGG